MCICDFLCYIGWLLVCFCASLVYIRGYQSAAQFRALGCNTWNANANKNQAWLDNPHRKGEDDMGLCYAR
jgi:thymidylate synthase